MPIMHDHFITYREETFFSGKILLCGAIVKLDHITVEFPRSNTIRHKLTPNLTPLKRRSARRTDRYLNNTRQTQETNIVSRLHLSNWSTLSRHAKLKLQCMFVLEAIKCLPLSWKCCWIFLLIYKQLGTVCVETRLFNRQLNRTLKWAIPVALHAVIKTGTVSVFDLLYLSS
jgi:hypothetical protein